MVYTVLSFLLALFFIGETIYTDKIESKKSENTNPIGANVLMCAILCFFYAVVVAVRSYIQTPLLSSLLKVCYLLEGCMLVNISFCFIYYAWGYLNNLLFIFKLILYVVVLYLTLFNFGTIRMNESGIVIANVNLLSGEAAEIFDINWYLIYNVAFRFFLPGFCCLVMICKNELSATKIDKYKGGLYALSLIIYWGFYVLFQFIVKEIPSFSYINYFIYLPLFVIIQLTYRMESVPSGRVTWKFILKMFTALLVPAGIFGVIVTFELPLIKDHILLFLVIFASIGLVTCITYLIKRCVTRNKGNHSSEASVLFEQSLAGIDYSGDMDKIAEKMFQIFKNHSDSSSMSVYINAGQGNFEAAYISSGKKAKIDPNNPIFEFLLNMGRNVIVAHEVENEYIFSTMKKELLEFFKDTDSDALIILNEGRAVHGLITLGIKNNKDPYKESDADMFKKLYSYFFVFGYYMRNISNKEIVGTVNRELRMSSQIITSIQENMDSVKTSRYDAGCIMVPANNIGGEFVDMIRLTDKRHLFVLGTVSGKGIAASMNMVILKAIIRAYLAETHNFKQLIVKINSFIRYSLPKGSLFSGLFAIMNFENDTMYYINCGNPTMFLYTEAYKNVIEIQGSGHMLGFVGDISPYITVKEMKLHKNDVVFCCSSGIIESHSLRGEQFGKDRVQKSFIQNRMYPAHRMAQFAFDDLVKFMSHEMEADVTIFILKYLENEEVETVEEEGEDGPGKITDGLDGGQSIDDIFANIEEM